MPRRPYRYYIPERMSGPQARRVQRQVEEDEERGHNFRHDYDYEFDDDDYGVDEDFDPFDISHEGNQVVPYRGSGEIRRGRYHPTGPLDNDMGISIEEALDMGLDVSDAINRYKDSRNEGEWLNDPKTGRPLYYKEKGDPNDPNYFWDPYNRKTNRRVSNNWLEDLTRNKFGIRHDVYVGDEPLRLIKDGPDPKRHPDAEGPYPNPPGSGISGISKRRYNPYDDGIRVQGYQFPPGEYAGREESFGGHLTSISRPSVKSKAPGSCTFTNSEYIQDISCISSGVFNLTNIPVNPGLPTTFPVLSQVAGAFLYYKFTKLCFRFVSLSNDTMTSSGNSVAQGVVCMAVNDNVASQPPVNLTLLANYPGAKTFKPSLSVKMEVDCTNQVANYYYVRTNTQYVPYIIDPTISLITYGEVGQPEFPGSSQLTDYITFMIGTSGSVGPGYTLAELHVDYSVELLSPVMYGSLNGGQCLYWRALIGSPLGNSSANGIPFPLNVGSGNLPCVIDTAQGAVPLRISFPVSIITGCYHIRLVTPISTLGVNWSSTSLQTPSLHPPSLAGCKIIEPFANYSGGTLNNVGYSWTTSPINYEPAGGGSTLFDSNIYSVSGGNTWSSAAILDLYIQITGSPCTLVWTTLTGDFPGQLYEGSIAINQIHPNFQFSWSSGGVTINP